MQKSKIEWLRNADGTMGYTWNPLKMRCDKFSTGCDNCWHLRFAKRHANNHTFSINARDAYDGGKPFLDLEELEEIGKLKKPSRIAVQLMGDLFHNKVTMGQQVIVFAEMLKAKHHTFFVLTKRVWMMKRFFDAACAFNNDFQAENHKHLWLGTSMSCQDDVGLIEPLARTRAANRWVSVEPMIGPVELGLLGTTPKDWHLGYNPISDFVNWVVCGAETGPKKRKMEQKWYNALQCECELAGVPFFGKVDSKGSPVGPRQIPEEQNQCNV